MYNNKNYALVKLEKFTSYNFTPPFFALYSHCSVKTSEQYHIWEMVYLEAVGRLSKSISNEEKGDYLCLYTIIVLAKR